MTAYTDPYSSKSSHFILFDAWYKLQSLLLQAWSAFLCISLVQSFLETMVCPLLEPTMLVCYGVLRHVVGPFVQSVLPQRIANFVRNYYWPMLLLCASPHPLAFFALCELFVVVLLTFCKNTKYYNDLHLFMRLPSQYAIRMGSGSFYVSDNCFYSNALSKGPSGKNVVYLSDDDDDNDDIKNKTIASINNLHLSQTLLCMNILSYHPQLIRPCIHDGMCPGTTYYTTRHNNLVHVLLHQSWAVIIINPIIGYDWWKLLLDDQVIGISDHLSTINATVREAYWKAMLHVGNSQLQFEHVSPSTTKSTTKQKQQKVRTVTVVQLLRYLSRQGIKLYATGHSLGGGVAHLLALHLQLAYKIDLAAIVTFGAPPVAGNVECCRLYAERVRVSWRYEHGVELGPLLPPFPFTGSTMFQHVGQRVLAQSLLLAEDASISSKRADGTTYSLDYLDEIAETEQLPFVLLDHNPFGTLRCLQAATAVLHDKLMISG